MERREFLGWVGTGAIASFLPVAIAACTPTNSASDSASDSASSTDTSSADSGANSSASEPDADGFVALGTIAELDEKGFLYDKSINAIVVRQSDGSLSALNPKCTHQQCPVEWSSASSTLSCPCHGSEFDLDGSVINGPAASPLASYEVKEDGGSVLVNVS